MKQLGILHRLFEEHYPFKGYIPPEHIVHIPLELVFRH